MRVLALACLPLLVGGTSTALFAQDAATGNAQGDVAVTIYNNGQSLVQDDRQLSVAAGRNRIEFPDVSARIRPETVTLSGPGIGIVEQNFDFDLLTPDKLMDKAVGQSITLVRTNPATGAERTERAKVLAANGGIVLQIGERIEVLRDDGLPVRAVFDRLPPNLRARPTLSVTVDAANAGTVPARLSYLTPNLSWTADYVALFDAAKGAMDIQGWVTLTNSTGTTFSNARTLLVAGSPGGGGGFRQMSGAMDSAGTESNDRERLGDYYLYPLAQRTTIANAQQKQVSFLDVKGAPARSTYEYVNRWLGSNNEPVSTASVLRFSTSRQGGLGDQLPAGTIRVYMRDARGDPQFIGENRIDHTPMGSAMSLRTGDAFDVKVQPTVVSRTRKGDSRWVTKMKYIVSNARPSPVTVLLAQDGLYGDVRISDESLKGERISADRVEWQVPVPANGKVDLTVAFDSRY
ncbi:hypothetical protein ATE68_09280 [Sphingopyxis sp. H038]|uniref:DUF4139 domain-containing protein n=1 Tax=unclassified Sphingopyxis TaxID=2614943 RepID=UPI00072FC05A|nr:MULTISPECIES: DUF4139 domain-containing protein [unclassified Sphingopyxis]KTE03853.1 hypothetical protein ATE78_05690 [Sphingopyxis sp. H012]KTE06323.1 hypothetical protein ATE76_19250 [Sphingopyxis sp. H093]KTE09317.1 hypothetical protein ATE70_15885 [Sphingopyxis sp. H053]KTE27636.1 hypothetical protein ATE75_12535 [Sphingopyxis sp. H080]KTE35183.1 hypothetical protein ATE68_09280 [Sphingopyxis sp. H038]